MNRPEMVDRIEPRPSTRPAQQAAVVADLAAAESRCCPFVAFTLHLAADELQLEVRIPPGASSPVTTALGGGR